SSIAAERAETSTRRREAGTFPAVEALPRPHDAPPETPAPLRWLVVGIAVSILLLVGLPVLMLVRREELVASIERSTPGLSPEWMGWVVVFVMAYSIVLHLLDVILLVWLTPKVLRGRRWARLTLSVYLVIATAGSLYSAAQGGMYLDRKSTRLNSSHVSIS